MNVLLYQKSSQNGLTCGSINDMGMGTGCEHEERQEEALGYVQGSSGGQGPHLSGTVRWLALC